MSTERGSGRTEISEGRNEPDRTRKWHATFRTKFATLGLFFSTRRNRPKIDPIARYTRLLAILTGLLVVIVGLQTIAFVMSERAFLTVSAISPNQPPLVPGKPLNLLVEIRNGGKSTGQVDQLNVSYKLLSGDLPDEPQYEEGSVLFSAPILPGSSTTFGLGPPKPTLVTAELVDGIVNGSTKFYLFGFIQYSDDFSLIGSRRTGFCYLYSPNGDARSSMFNGCGKRKYVYAR